MRYPRRLVMPLALATFAFGMMISNASAQQGVLTPGAPDYRYPDIGGLDYTTDDYGYQALPGWSPSNAIKSFSPWKWVQGNLNVPYSVTADIQADVDTVVANYNAAFSYSTLQLFKNQASPDVTIDSTISACSSGSAGCFLASNFILYGDAYWPRNGVIHIDPSLPQDQRRTVIAHEIGHLYGLGEGYFKNDGYYLCNRTPGRTSVMNAVGCDGLPPGPTAGDQQRLTTYWTAQPVVVNAFAPIIIGGRVLWTWKSQGWTDYEVHYSAEYIVDGQSYASGYLSPADMRFKWQDWRTALGAITTSPQASGVPNNSAQRICMYTNSWARGTTSQPVCSGWYTITYGSNSVGLWRMDESSGTTTADSSGNNNTGTLVNSPDRLQGKAGNALRFNVYGANQYVNIPSSSSVNVGTGDFSVSFWIDPDNDSYCCYNILAKWNSYGIDYWEMGGPKYIRLFFFTGDTGQYLVRSSSQVNRSSGWNHIVWVISRTNGPQRYVNGNLTPIVEINPGNRTANLDSSNPLRFATLGDQGYKLSGKLDEVRLYNRALSQAEALNLYNNPGG